MMKHFLMLFYFIVFTTGFALIILGLFIWLKNKQEALKYFIISAFALTLILFEQMVTAYNIVNMIQSNPLDITIRYISTIGCGLMIYALTKLIWIIRGTRSTKKKEWGLILFSVLPLIMMTLYYITDNLVMVRVAGFLFFGTVLYNMIVLIGNIEKIEDHILKSAIKKFLVVSLLMFPILFFDTFVEKLPKIGEDFPFGLLSVFAFYLIFCSISIYYLIKNYHVLLNQPTEPINTGDEDPEVNSDRKIGLNDNKEKLFESFKITPREKEIIELLINGYSYNRICDELVIALPTVKTHTHNIYKKLGIRNKIELINLVIEKNN